MQLTPQQKQAIEQQKQACPFCKIVKGEIPAKKVYEDDLFIAVLDINPAVKGHMLLVPKEHYPIMPIIPETTLEKMFSLTKELCSAAQKAMVVHGNTVFVANGAAAGQQSQHFLMHIIPREKKDSLGIFEIPKKSFSNEQTKILGQLGNAVNSIARTMWTKQAESSGSPLLQPLPSGTAKKDYLKGVIEMNKPLLELVLKQPDQFKQLAQTHEQLKELFKDQNIGEIIGELRKKYLAEEKKDEEKKKDTEEKTEIKKETKKKEKESDLDTIAELFK